MVYWWGLRIYPRISFVPEEYKGKKVLIEFEGIYHNGEVYINGKRRLTVLMVIPIFMWIQRAFFQYGKENEIKVIARNADQPNSRWLREPVFTVRLICMLGKKTYSGKRRENPYFKL